MRALVGVAAAAAAAAALVVAPAHAAENLRVGIADDRILLAHPERAPGDRRALEGAWGSRSVRIHRALGGGRTGRLGGGRAARLRASDPDDPHYDWAFLDFAVDLLTVAGIEPMLAVTGSGPLWTSRDPGRGNPRYKPDPHKFGAFATAVARRYGDRVDRYVLYNEPNHPGWLQPQFECPRPGRCTPDGAAHLPRPGQRRRSRGSSRADPGAQIYVGALAPRGGDPTRRNRPMRPLPFIRAFGCLDARLRADPHRPVPRLQARADRRVRLPPPRRAAQPARAQPEARRGGDGRPRPADIRARPVQDFGRLDTSDGGRIDIHLTEFGYQTRPPDPYSGVSTVQQKLLVAAGRLRRRGRDPRVRTLIQYEWEDEPDQASRARAARLRGLAVGAPIRGRPRQARARRLRATRSGPMPAAARRRSGSGARSGPAAATPSASSGVSTARGPR